MKIGIAALLLAYVLSQFYRAFLAVLSPALGADLGAAPADLAFASGVWFLTFAAMQVPVGAALDRVGPRRTTALVLAIGGGGGALLFALAQSPLQITLAMALIGVGCSPILMASYYIFARVYPAALFGTLAGATVGFGSLGNIAGSVPLAWAVQVLGWRATMAVLAGLSLMVAGLVLALVRDPVPSPRAAEGKGASVLDVLAIRALWPIFAMMFVAYAPAAAIRGLWAGPYLGQVHGADAAGIGRGTLIMALAMIAGSLAYGPLERWMGTRKWVIFGGNLLTALACLALAAWPQQGLWTGTLLLAAVGMFGATFALVLAHARAFVPPHLIGRGITLINLFSILGAATAQFATGPLFAAVRAADADPAAPFTAIFLGIGLAILGGLAVYLLARDRTD